MRRACGNAIPSARGTISQQGGVQADLVVRTVLRSRRKFTRGQVMFFTRGDRVRLAGLEYCVSRVGVGLRGWDGISQSDDRGENVPCDIPKSEALPPWLRYQQRSEKEKEIVFEASEPGRCAEAESDAMSRSSSSRQGVGAVYRALRVPRRKVRAICLLQCILRCDW